MDYGPLALILVFVVIGIVLWLLNQTKPKSTTRRPGKAQAFDLRRLSPAEYQAHWQRIEQTLNNPGTDSTRTAILEADKLVDTALKQKGFQGQTMGDRLKDARDFFGNNAVYQGLWQAHKMRNALAHELNFDLPKQIAHQHLDQFKAALQQMGML